MLRLSQSLSQTLHSMPCMASVLSRRFGVICALDVVRQLGHRHIDLVLDNVGAICQVLWGKDSTVLVA